MEWMSKLFTYCADIRIKCERWESHFFSNKIPEHWNGLQTTNYALGCDESKEPHSLIAYHNHQFQWNYVFICNLFETTSIWYCIWNWRYIKCAMRKTQCHSTKRTIERISESLSLFLSVYWFVVLFHSLKMVCVHWICVTRRNSKHSWLTAFHSRASCWKFANGIHEVILKMDSTCRRN